MQTRFAGSSRVIWVLVGDPRHFDGLISASYLFYLVALSRLWRRGPDGLSYAHVEVTRGLSNWTLRGAGMLAFVLLLDTAIAPDFALNGGAHVPALISFGSVPLIITMLIALVTIPRMVKAPQTVSRSAPLPDQGEVEVEVEARLCALMRQDQLYLDPDITVQRLARRLHLPARTLSA